MGLRASPTVQLVLRRPARAGDQPARRGAAAASSTRCSRSTTGGSGIAAQAIGIARAALEHVGGATPPSGGSSASRSRSSRRSSSSWPTWRRASPPSRALLHAAAAAQGPRRARSRSSASMAKLFASETAMWVTTAGDADLRRLRLREGLSGRAAVPRREGHRDLRGHVGDPAHRHRARAVLAQQLTFRQRSIPPTPSRLPMKLFDTIAGMGHEQLVLCHDTAVGLPRHHRHPRHRRSVPRSAARASGTTRPTRTRSSTRCASRAA